MSRGSNPNRENSLFEYHAVLSGKAHAKYLSTDMTRKVSQAYEIYRTCHFCQRRCGINRAQGEHGVCGVTQSRVASRFVHWGEESILIPSFTVFFSGCTIRCLYCQNWDISQFPNAGIRLDPKTLATEIATVKAHNVNWVGGDPTPHIYFIFQVLEASKRNIPQIWNSNMMCSKEAMALLDGVMDVYLTDFKYGNDACAQKLSNTPNYVETVKQNHIIAKDQGDVLIRHLVLPHHFECCSKPILQWLAQHLPNTPINIMDQYRPCWRAQTVPELVHSSYKDYQKALELAQTLGLKLLD